MMRRKLAPVALTVPEPPRPLDGREVEVRNEHKREPALVTSAVPPL